MNQLIAKIVSLLISDRKAENSIDLSENSISTAACLGLRNLSNFIKAKDA